MSKQEKALLVVSFGTSHSDTREKTIDKIEQQLAAAFPERRFYRAWTSGMIVKKLRERDGLCIDTVQEALERMLRDGITDVLVQPTHLLGGIENDKMRLEIAAFRRKFGAIRIAPPLLAAEADLQRVAEILSREFRALPEDEAVLFMGHGTEHCADAVYAELDSRFRSMGKNFYMATVEGCPTLEDVMRRLAEKKSVRRVLLTPFMIVAGDHAKNDMAGDGEDSWRNMVAGAGYEVTCLARGLGELPEIRELLADHARQAERGSALACGTLTGVGVGPGDPELLTVKALKRIQSCDMLVLPDSERGNCVAYRIVEQAWPDVRKKPAMSVQMPMTHDKAVMDRSHRAAAEKIERELEAGKQLVFLTLGDPTVYSTYLYVHRLVEADGYPAEIVPGIPSFCAAAARLGEALGMGAEMIHIIPSSHGVSEGLKLPGVKVLMKAGSKMGEVKKALEAGDMDACMVENCGMEQERRYYSAADIPAEAGYFSLIIARDRRKQG